MTDRNLSFDFLRAVAAFFVIYIHIDYNGYGSSEVGLFVKMLLRWCVPIFFLMAGYFLHGASISESISWKRISRVAKITLFANAIFLPLYVLRHKAIDFPYVLINGTWYHLWFMNALLFGFICLKVYFQFIKSSVLFSTISVAIFSGFLYEDLRIACEHAETSGLLMLLRFLQAAPLIWIGFLMGKYNFSVGPVSAVSLFLVGTLICFAEAWCLDVPGNEPVRSQFPFGAVPMTFGLFWAFGTITLQRKNVISTVGARYSLHIYLLHPIVLTCIEKGGAFAELSQNAVLLLTLILGPVISFLLPSVLDVISPWFLKLLSGTWTLKRGRPAS